MAFCFEPTQNSDVNERFCWLLLDWFTEAERSAADDAILAHRHGEPEDSEMKTPSRRHYEAVVAASRNVSEEMRGFSHMHNPTYGAEAIAQMIEPAIHPRYREPRPGAEVRSAAANAFDARRRAKYGSGSAIVEMLLRQAKQQVGERL